MDWSTLHWPGGAPWWVLLIVAAGLGWALVRRHRDLAEKLPARRVWVLQVLRGLLYAAVVFFLSGPTLIDKRVRSLPPKLLVLLDSSASMSVQDVNRKKTRIDLAKDFLLVPKKPGKSEAPAEKEQGDVPESLLAGLKKLYDVQLARYDARRAPIGVRELEDLKAQGVGSDPLGAIRSALDSAREVARSGGEGRAKKPGRPPRHPDAHGRGGYHRGGSSAREREILPAPHRGGLRGAGFFSGHRHSGHTGSAHRLSGKGDESGGFAFGEGFFGPQAACRSDAARAASSEPSR